MKNSDIKDISLWQTGEMRLQWVKSRMPVLRIIRDRFKKVKPLRNIRIGACLHITAETANLLITLKEGGAKVSACASNPLSTQDEIAATLVKNHGISVFAIKGVDKKTYYSHIKAVLDSYPQITMDDGADLVTALHTERKDQLKEVIGSSEETTTGVIRLRAMEKEGTLKIPVLAVNDSATKHFFDNRYGTGQSTLDGIIRATDILIAGKKFVVCGYGWCGKGIASRARGLGAQVIVTEVDPVKALEALMDGYEVMPIDRAVSVAEIVVTATGDKHVVNTEHMIKMKDGVILANSGHFNVEIDYEGLEKRANAKKKVREFVEEFTMSSGKKINVIGEARLVNLVAATGHPPEVMDMSFANQLLAAEWFIKEKGRLLPKVYKIPPELDEEIARLKLESMGVVIDALTDEQRKYLTDWREGT